MQFNCATYFNKLFIYEMVSTDTLVCLPCSSDESFQQCESNDNVESPTGSHSDTAEDTAETYGTQDEDSDRFSDVGDPSATEVCGQLLNTFRASMFCYERSPGTGAVALPRAPSRQRPTSLTVRKPFSNPPCHCNPASICCLSCV